MKSQLVAILGPSAAGKSTLIRRLGEQGAARYIRPFTTRALRPEEDEKINVSMGEMFALQRQGQLLALQEVFGNWYGMPYQPILEAQAAGLVPMIDWPVDRLAWLKQRFPGRVTAVYLVPPSEHALRLRLQDGRDQDGTRLRLALAELQAVERGDYQGLVDFYIRSTANPDALASRVRSTLKQAFRPCNAR